ncbi:hypothetical protein MM221_19835 [Salipaludibacillus sp. LMS25]|jgi:hypothetical protein|nr:hypothetical protein [Salipaludibacillus sp. LMS25]UTR14769.1 hypothetical protein MM221_19835 [Salipaludibacillus sp. LMS25]
MTDKQTAHNEKRVTTSVNPLGKTPDSAHKGDILSKEQERAKKKNTRI